MNRFKKSYSKKVFGKKALAVFAILLAATTFSVSSPAVMEAARPNAGYVGEVIAGPGVAVAETKAGTLQGYVHKGIYNYKGVQYAEAKRFEEPQPVKPWAGIKTAMNYTTVAPQFTDQKNDIFPPHWYWPHWEPRNLQQSEDCQNLNIWTPGIKDGKKRPVMAWLHGGGYFAGSASVEDVYDGENLSRKGDVVVVSVNHRLNSLGFLDLSAYGKKYEKSGNAGILDIVAALQWVHENIAEFGGDPNNVTLFGQSGGGAKVLTLTSMPAAKGLFHKAVVQSGGVELTGMSLPDQEVTRRVAELTLAELGLSAAEVDKLQTIPYEQFATAANTAYVKAGKEFRRDRVRSGASWSPVVDGKVVPDNPVLSKNGFQPQAKEIPLLIGTVANEWATIHQWATMAASQTDNKNNWSEAEVQKRLQDKYGANADAVLREFRKAYP
ncbi:MAG: carboxylesterase/lipase family protein, partial [Acidaminococcaceae bacterium]|nr:carboxylesterase/lipase family protein [Acidaminococcaceae bacterium]